MSSIYFKLNETQENELQTLMAKEGFTSRAGFFRFLIKFYKFHQPSHPSEIARTPQAITPDDSNLSPEKQRLLNDPRIFDEEVRQFIREMEE